MSSAPSQEQVHTEQRIRNTELRESVERERDACEQANDAERLLSGGESPDADAQSDDSEHCAYEPVDATNVPVESDIECHHPYQGLHTPECLSRGWRYQGVSFSPSA